MIKSYFDIVWYCEVFIFCLCVVFFVVGFLIFNVWFGDFYNVIEIEKKIVIRFEEEICEEVIREKVKVIEERIGIEVGRF